MQSFVGAFLSPLCRTATPDLDTCLTGCLSLCPLTGPWRNVVDIGCGTGAWAIHFARWNPSSCVTGMDLSPIQPSVVPSNVGSFTALWRFDHALDYIHSRAITAGFRDWEKLVDETWRNLEPGRWVDIQEYHLPGTSDNASISSRPKFDL